MAKPHRKHRHVAVLFISGRRRGAYRHDLNVFSIQLFLQAGRKETRLIYNYLDAMASIMDLKIAIANSYTCLSFACAVIGRQFRRIEDLNKALEPNLFYEGSLAKLVPDSGSRDDSYFEPIGFFKGNWHSARQMVLVTFRFLRHRRWDFVDQKLARHR